jgi:CHAT domain-containing protein
MYRIGGTAAAGRAFPERPTDMAVLVEYFAVGARLVAFVVRPESGIPEAHELDVDPSRVENMARESVFAARNVRKEETAANGSQEWLEVSGALAAPALRRTVPGEVVWFVGHGALHVLPLHAAPLPDGDYLIDRNPVCYTPSATVMRFCQDKQRDRERSGVVVGDPGGDLPHAATEARSVARLLGSEPLLGGSATKSEILRQLGQGSPLFLHFACHGYFDPLDPMSSGIELSGSGDTGRDQPTAGLPVFQALAESISRCQQAGLARAGDDPYWLAGRPGLGRAARPGAAPAQRPRLPLARPAGADGRSGRGPPHRSRNPGGRHPA